MHFHVHPGLNIGGTSLGTIGAYVPRDRLFNDQATRILRVDQHAVG